MTVIEPGSLVTVIEPGSRWVAKDGSRTVRVEFQCHWGDWYSVISLETRRVYNVSRSGLLRKYRRVEQGADQ